jgi:hypothetical protein
MCQQDLVELTNMRFHENSFSVSDRRIIATLRGEHSLMSYAGFASRVRRKNEMQARHISMFNL